MKRYYLVIAIGLSLLLGSCAKDFYSLFGLDVDAPISLELTGSRYEWDGELFASDGGYYSYGNHPDLIIHEDGGFTFDLHRSLGSEVGKGAELSLHIDDYDAPYELNKVYSLVILGDAYASITFRERGMTYPLPSGTTVTEYITHEYKAKDGYIIFTKQEEYGDGYLLSGEFKFRGVCEDGDEISVENGTFRDCRVHESHGDSCEGW